MKFTTRMSSFFHYCRFQLVSNNVCATPQQRVTARPYQPVQGTADCTSASNEEWVKNERKGTNLSHRLGLMELWPQQFWVWWLCCDSVFTPSKMLDLGGDPRLVKSLWGHFKWNMVVHGRFTLGVKTGTTECLLAPVWCFSTWRL